MKRIKSVIKCAFVAIPVLFMICCGAGFTSVNNSLNKSTQVRLQGDNFKVVGPVTGQSSHTYILGMGGVNKKALIENSKAKMYQNAYLTGKARAVIYVTSEVKVKTIACLYTKVYVTTSGVVIEFTK